jgi:hypothetical protein
MARRCGQLGKPPSREVAKNGEIGSTSKECRRVAECNSGIARGVTGFDRRAADCPFVVERHRPGANGGDGGSFEEISVAGAEGHIFLYSAGTKGVLAVIGPAGCNAGLVHLEARGVAKELGEQFN